MFEIRCVVVLDRLVVSVWCRSHGAPAHCLWSNGVAVELPDVDDLLLGAADALHRVAVLAHRGELPDLTGDCCL